MPKKPAFLLLILLFACLGVYSQDRLFNYTYQSGVLQKGLCELEVWNTLKLGRENYFARLDHRSEFEVGLGHNLQTAFYLNLTSITETETEDLKKSLHTSQEIGFSNEWKLKVLDPVSNPIGLAVYGEYGILSNEYELEAKVIVDKMIGNFTFAVNGVYEKELQAVLTDKKTTWEEESRTEYLLAIAYALNTEVHFTLESTWGNIYKNGELEHSAMYSGPGLSYNIDKFWMNLTFMPQLISFKGDTDHNLNLKEFEKLQIRLLFSYEI